MISGMARHELVGYALMGVGMVLCWGLLITDIVVLIRFATVDQRRQPTVRGLIKRRDTALALRIANYHHWIAHTLWRV